MVKLTFASAFFFLVAFFTLTVASPTETRTMDVIMQTMSKSIKNGLSVLSAIALHTEFKSVEKNLNQLEQDVSTAKSVANAQAIFNAVHDLTPTVVNALKAVTEKKSIFVQLSASQYVLKQLIKAEKATAKVAAAMIAMGPVGLFLFLQDEGDTDAAMND
ncbi:hypothetical protein F5887DRAFT_915127 [Amanita rubescens]|nr:hypothetical protein F5887DRAFT_915127 [Amanita rubescens]